jgi:hypothetical protein
LDRFYSLQPGRPQGAKRLVIVADEDQRRCTSSEWVRRVGDFATLVWKGDNTSTAELDEHEYVMALR